MWTVGNFLAKVREAIIKKQVIIEVQINKSILNILWVLYKEGYICSFQINGQVAVVNLKYVNGKAVITRITQISKISRRVYKKASVGTIYSPVIISTGKGIGLYDYVGGEVLFKLC